MSPTDVSISTDGSTKGWGTTCQGISIGRPWSLKKQKAYINMVELKAVHLTILTFTKIKIVQRMHLQIDNKVVLSYLVQMGALTTRTF